MVAIINPQHGFSPSSHQSSQRVRPGARHLHAVPSFSDVAFPELAMPELAIPELALPEFELGRRLAAAVPSLRPTLLRLDDVVDFVRWGGSAAVRFALLAVALLVAVVMVRVSQGVPPEAPSQFVSSGVSAVPSASGSAASGGDVVLTFSAEG